MYICVNTGYIHNRNNGGVKNINIYKCSLIFVQCVALGSFEFFFKFYFDSQNLFFGYIKLNYYFRIIYFLTCEQLYNDRNMNNIMDDSAFLLFLSRAPIF